MRWNVLTVTNPIHTFLTSDRPVVMTDGVNRWDSFIIVPIGPTQAFVAVNTIEMERHLQGLSVEKFMILLNDRVSRQACDFVYGDDDKQLRFVDKRLGKGLPQFIASKRLQDSRKGFLRA